MKSLKPVILFLILSGVTLVSCTKNNNPPVRKPPVVWAGASQSIALPVDSARLTGKAIDSSSTIVAYLWSEVSGPNVPVITSEGSLSTSVTGLISGTYIFQLMAVDTFGLTGVDTMIVSVSGGKSGPITLAPMHNINEYTYIGTGTTDYSEGVYPRELGAETWTEGGTQVEVRSALRFDLSSLPNTTIASAKLTLYSNPTPFTANLTVPDFGTSNAFYIQRINTAWDPTHTSWSTQPGTDTTNEVLIPQNNASSLDLPDIDVTPLVRTMISSGNYGFMIRLQNEVIYNSRIYCSSSYSDSTKVPKLVITF